VSSEEQGPAEIDLEAALEQFQLIAGELHGSPPADEAIPS
jgi:hypothetical protein